MFLLNSYCLMSDWTANFKTFCDEFFKVLYLNSSDINKYYTKNAVLNIDFANQKGDFIYENYSDHIPKGLYLVTVHDANLIKNVVTGHSSGPVEIEGKYYQFNAAFGITLERNQDPLISYCSIYITDIPESWKPNDEFLSLFSRVKERLQVNHSAGSQNTPKNESIEETGTVEEEGERTENERNEEKILVFPYCEDSSTLNRPSCVLIKELPVNVDYNELLTKLSQTYGHINTYLIVEDGVVIELQNGDSKKKIIKDQIFVFNGKIIYFANY